MDEKPAKKRRRWLQLNVRDLFWLVLTVAVGCAYWQEHRRSEWLWHEREAAKRRVEEWERRATYMSGFFKD